MSKNKIGSVSTATVLSVIAEYYQIEGSISRLPGENLNYLMRANTGPSYIVKIAGEETPPEQIEMECAAVRHAVNAPLDLMLPKIIENKYGQLETGIVLHQNEPKRLRLVSFIAGKNLSDIADISATLRIRIGKAVAEFDRALVGFDHPAAHRKHRWNLVDALQHRHKAALVKDPERREILIWAFDQFANHAAPVLAGLAWQFIHGDPNPENIRVKDERVTGLLDFGDSCHNPAICDLAICLAYQMMDQADPCSAAREVISGYESVRPMSPGEHRALLPLVCGRLAVTIAVAAERREIDPDNANWFVSERPAWGLLGCLKSRGAVPCPASQP